MTWRATVPGTVALVAGLACSSDASFTSLKSPEAPVEDTSAPPVEVEEEVIPDTPPTCPDRIYSGLPTTVREDCRIDPPVVRYTPVVEWQRSEWEDYPISDQFLTTPVTGQLTDDDGDGLITSADIPDILTLSYRWSPRPTEPDWVALRLISGDGTSVHWSRTSWMVDDVRLRPITAGAPALGDTDQDGVPEIYLVLGPSPASEDSIDDYLRTYRHSGSVGCYVTRLDPSGAIAAINTDQPVTCRAHSPTLADVQSDGEIDVVVGNETFRTSDLERISTPITDSVNPVGMGRNEGYWTGGIPVVADLDGDGFMELVTGRHIQEWDGTVRCFTGDLDGYAAVADLNGDGRGEFVVTGDGRVRVFDESCAVLNAWPLDALGGGGPATVADYDGDGVPEVGIAAADAYMVYEADGTLKWSSPATDFSSNSTGSSVFDFEEDGYAEVVYADETDLWVISGHSGDFVMRWAGHFSGTANEHPVIVDVDGDGEAEIVTVGDHGIAVLAAEEGWAPARQVWNQHAYWITNVHDDLTIPSPTPQNWPEYNSFRSGDLRVNAGQGARLVDAKPFVHDICEIECADGFVYVALSPNNEGLADAVDGVNLAVYAEQTDGSRVLIEVLTPEDLHRSGYATEGVVLELAMTDLPTGTLILVADDDGTGTGVIEECDETNNELRLEGLCSDE